MTIVNPIIGDILIIEEDENYRSELVDYMTQFHLKITPLVSETHALQYMQGQPWSWYPGTIICDIVMAGMGGYEFLRRISETYPKRNIVKILHSKLNSPTDILEGELAGADAFIKKPIELKTFYESLILIANSQGGHKGIRVIE